MRKSIFLFIIFTNLFSINIAYSADISLADKNTVILAGPIIKGDLQRLKRTMQDIPYGNGLVILHSQGGAAYEGIAIGEYIQANGFSTLVLPNNECYSACAIIWSSGKYKFAEPPSSIIGFHAIYNGYTTQEVGYANAKLGAVLGRWGYSDNAIEFMTIASPSQFSYLTPQNATKYEIIYVDTRNYNSYQPNTNYVLSAYDVVAGFYSALSQADGDLAAAYVIPEKRGIGPFNQFNIYRFYSSLKKPLTIRNITQLNSTQFQVKYDFVKTKSQCNGTAIVNLTYRNGYYLIQSIKANC
ncbi:hypothetical protein [Actinobacillus equuli]|uniref:COG3904 family protein n=1 Tax=Actinobacillus equuli TaxID=718 RepID=UPI00244324A2|nr:hypothetical protein [Actinobacillus equuli]WGE42880.1 hypothetical protein NYR64_03305 [Actinobacillus equuli subsp. haemolyticus]